MRTIAALALLATALTANAGTKPPTPAPPECTTLGCCLNQGPGSEFCCTPGHYCPIN